MPHAEISKGAGKPYDGDKYKPPHERPSGPWDDYELEDGGHALERAEKIKANAKYVDAIAKHHEKKAKVHSKLAVETRALRRSGKISDEALRKASAKHA